MSTNRHRTKPDKSAILIECHELALRVSTLKARLTEARDCATTPRDQARHGQLSARIALAGVLDFLLSFDDLALLAQPLNALNCAFLDGDEGVRNPVFAPTKVGHRPGMSIARKHQRYAALLAVETALAAGRNLKEAQEFVVAKFEQAYRLRPSQSLTPITLPTLRKWREQTTGAADDPEEAARVRQFMDQELQSNGGPLDAERFIESLARYALTGRYPLAKS